MNKYQQEVVDEAPKSCKRIMERAVLGEAAPRSAIKAFCLRCVGYLRAEVTGCTAYRCPLYPYRPYQTGEEVEEEAEGAEEAA